MSRRPVAIAGSAGLVIAAMAVGRLVADHVPGEINPHPFVRTAAVNETLSLRYAEAEVTGVYAADNLLGVDTAIARGVFVVVDLQARGVDAPEYLDGFELMDSDGLRYSPTTRAQCSGGLAVDPGATAHARLCFDVPPGVIAGMTLRIAIQDASVDGASQRRDDVGDVDLGISDTDARKMLAADLTLKASNDPLVAPDPEPQPAPQEGS